MSFFKKFGTANLFLWVVLLIFLGIAYSPLWHAGFGWDDFRYVTNNLNVKNPNGLWAIWSHDTTTVNYWPLSHTAFWLQYRLWGINPLGYHLVNVVLHGFNAMLLFLGLWKMGLKSAFWPTALFSLHPLNVETVAWISELKNVLSMSFFLLSVMAFQSWLSQHSNKYYLLSLWCFVCAMLSKSSTVVLPVLLLILLHSRQPKLSVKDFWQGSKKELALLVPFFVVGLIMSILLLLEEARNPKELITIVDWSLVEKLIVGCKAFLLYLSKWLWPYPLMLMYPFWPIEVPPWFNLWPVFAFLAVFLVVLGLWRRGWHSEVYCFVYSFCACVPILGFFHHQLLDRTWIMNHFVYLATLGWAVGSWLLLLRVRRALMKFSDGSLILTKGLAVLARGSNLGWKIIGCGVLLLCVRLDYPLTITYQNDYNAWQANYQHNPDSFWVTIQLSELYLSLNRLQEAEVLIQKAKTTMDHPLNYDFEATLAFKQNDNQKSLEILNKGVEKFPQSHRLFIKRGLANARVGNEAQMLLDFYHSHELSDEPIEILMGRVTAWISLEKYQQALEDCEEVATLDPTFGGLAKQRGYVQFKLNQYEPARESLLRALKESPNDAEIYYLLGRIQQEQQHWEVALDYYNQALALFPIYGDAFHSRGFVLLRMKQKPLQICQDWQKACELGVCDNLNWAKEKGQCLQ